MLSRPRRTLAVLLLSAVPLAGCSGGDPADTSGQQPGQQSGQQSGQASSGGSTEPAPYPSAPDTVTLTEPGAALTTGETATVAWQPEQSLVGVVDLTVTALESTTFRKSFRGWRIDQATEALEPFFVRATVANVGETELAGRPVPLYAVGSDGALVEPSAFGGDFEPCRPSALPQPFAPGGSAEVCLVYLLADGTTLSGVTFRPTEEFDPIVWSGEVAPHVTPKPGRKGGERRDPGEGPTATAGATATPDPGP